MTKVLIVGAGISGVSAARVFVENGYQVELFDKSRGVGGRMSTRRMTTARADHGAQYFSAKTPEFQETVRMLVDNKIVKPWKRFESDKHDRYVGIAGMSSVPKSLSHGLTLHTSEKIVLIRKSADSFEIESESGKVFTGEHLIITIPAPQVIDLLTNSNLDSKALADISKVVYDPCFALMLHTNKEVHLPKNKLESGPFAWQMSNTEKGMTDSFSYTLHTSHEFSIKYLENPVADTKTFLLAHLPDCFKGIEIIESQLHRWRYSIAQQRLDTPFLLSQSGIYYGGDGYGKGNVEGAFTSGIKIAEDLLSKK